MTVIKKNIVVLPSKSEIVLQRGPSSRHLAVIVYFAFSRLTRAGVPLKQLVIAVNLTMMFAGFTSRCPSELNPH